MQKPTPTAASPETRLIPLNKLRFDERNARSASEDPARIQADAELVASIRHHGLLENLVVAPRSKTLFGVAAGARRLRALNALAADKHIPKNHPVPCLVVEPEAAAESSLAENVVRIPMHPADQVVAFSRLAREGATTEQIAARFGVAERTVQKRVRLGGLADEIIDAYREGRINADAAEAFAVTADTDFQRNIFKGLAESGQLHGHAVRRAIGARLTRSDAPACLYVGLDAYRAAGGTTEDPLFEDDHVSILDPELMEKLALQKLNAEAAKYADDWKWTAAQTEFGWLDQQNHLVAHADTRAQFTGEEAAALKEAEETIEQAHARLDTFDSDLDAAGRRELWDIVTQEQNRYAEIERARADRDVYSETVRAHAGVVVALDRDGDLEIHRGLVRAEDADAYRAARAGERSGDGNGADGTASPPDSPDAPHVPPVPDATPPGKRNGGWTDALRNDLRIMRTAAVRRVLARSPAVATDLIGFVLARIVGFGRPHTGYESPILALRKEYQGVYASDAMKSSEPMKHLDPVPAVDLGWLAEPDAALAFRAYRALSDEDRASVLAHAVAQLTVPRLCDDHDASGAHEEAVRRPRRGLPGRTRRDRRHAVRSGPRLEPHEQGADPRRRGRRARRRLGFEAQRPEEGGPGDRGGRGVPPRSGARRRGRGRRDALAAAGVRPAAGRGPRNVRDDRGQRRVRRGPGRRGRPARGRGRPRGAQRRHDAAAAAEDATPDTDGAGNGATDAQGRRRRAPRVPRLLRLLPPRQDGAGLRGPAATDGAPGRAFFASRPPFPPPRASRAAGP